MIDTFGLYLGKATLISGIFYVYYHLALKDKQTFSWNRFYLLTATGIALMVPLLNIPIHWNVTREKSPTLIHLLNVLPGAGEKMTDVASAGDRETAVFTWATVLLLGYAAVVVFLLGRLVYHLHRLSRLKHTAPQYCMDDITLINTNTPGTPFSFFNWIFWNDQLPLESEAGRQIFLHELAHVRRGHSLDKIGMQIFCTLLFPVFPLYFIRRELQLVHEYQADHEATGRRDIDAYATYLLQHALNGRPYDLSNAFHQHPLVRRIAMMNNSLLLRGGAAAWRRWMVLPLFAVAIGLFAFTVHRTFTVALLPAKDDAPPLTVVIDPGHGGTDIGADADNGYLEKDIVLGLARTIARLAPGYPVRVLLSRDADTLVTVMQRVAFSNEHHADLFISLHVNLGRDTVSSGIQTYVSDLNRFYDSSVVLGSILEHRLGEVYTSEPVLRNLRRHVMVLSKTDCPSVLIECGYMGHRPDVTFMSNPSNQEAIAREILASVTDYAKGTSRPSIPIETSKN